MHSPPTNTDLYNAMTDFAFDELEQQAKRQGMADKAGQEADKQERTRLEQLGYRDIRIVVQEPKVRPQSGVNPLASPVPTIRR